MYGRNQDLSLYVCRGDVCNRVNLGDLLGRGRNLNTKENYDSENQYVEEMYGFKTIDENTFNLFFNYADGCLNGKINPVLGTIVIKKDVSASIIINGLSSNFAKPIDKLMDLNLKAGNTYLFGISFSEETYGHELGLKITELPASGGYNILATAFTNNVIVKLNV